MLDAMNRPTVVLLPGLLCDQATWAEQCAALASSAQCVVPSYGPRDSIEAMARGVLDEVQAERFALVGHSMGARVALEIMRLASQRVRRLALFDTGLDPIASGADGERERSQRHALVDLALSQGMRAMGLQWAPGMVMPGHREAPVFERILAMIERKTPEIFAAQVRALLGRPDARAVFAGIRCPVLIGCGRQDAWSPLARHEQMQCLLPHSRLVVIEDAGHMSPMEQPAAVAQALVEWLAPAEAAH
jgi:pimeloyl-ACP methyl ester carboxylesterase